jgi:hypothetical protein
MGNETVNDFLMGAPDRGNIQRFKWPVMAAFHSLLLSDVPTRFPQLRFGFIEAGASWIPYLLGDLTRRVAWTHGNINDTGPTKCMLKDNNLFVTCQTNDDLPYVLKVRGRGQPDHRHRLRARGYGDRAASAPHIPGGIRR